MDLLRREDGSSGEATNVGCIQTWHLESWTGRAGFLCTRLLNLVDGRISSRDSEQVKAYEYKLQLDLLVAGHRTGMPPLVGVCDTRR